MHRIFYQMLRKFCIVGNGLKKMFKKFKVKKSLSRNIAILHKNCGYRKEIRILQTFSNIIDHAVLFFFSNVLFELKIFIEIEHYQTNFEK